MTDIISVVGAGGKTTYIEKNSRYLSQKKDVLVSTTTKMRLPHITKYDKLILKRHEFETYKNYFLRKNTINKQIYNETDKNFEKYDYIVLSNRLSSFNPIFDEQSLKNKTFLKKTITKSLSHFKKKTHSIYYFLTNIKISDENQKYMHITDDEIYSFSRYFDTIFLEADGAKKRRLKYPKTHEPVISKYTTKTVAIVDITVLGCIVDEKIIYNIDDFLSNLNTNIGYKINLDILIQLIKDKNALFKNAIGQKILFFSKVTTKEHLKYIDYIKDKINNTI